MNMPPAARITDMTVCPMVTGLVPHVGGPIITGQFNVIVCGMPQARITDIAQCVGPPATIIRGSPTVIVGNQPAARIGDQTNHGGTIITGCPTVLIGEVGISMPPVVTPSVMVPEVPTEAEVKEITDKIAKGESSIKVEGIDEYKKKVMESIKLLAQTTTGMKLLKSLEASGKNTTIKIPDFKTGTKVRQGNSEDAATWDDGLYDTANKKPGPGTDTTVTFNPDKDKLNGEPWMTRDPAIGLGHELIHADHDQNGTTDGRAFVEYTDASGNKRRAPGYEVQTVGMGEHKDNEITENKLRDEFNSGNLGKNSEEKQRPRY